MTDHNTLRVPTIFTRIRTAIGLLAGLRDYDVRLAKSYIDRTYPDLPRWIQLSRFGVWAAKQVFVTIPAATVNATFSRKISPTSIWLAGKNPLANHPWAEQPDARLPEQVEVVVVGAGFTGAASAYHWSRHGTGQMAVLEMNEAASGASGRNEGVVVMGRFYAYARHTVRKSLDIVRPDLSDSQRDSLASRFGEAYVRAAYKNADLIEQTVADEGFGCDYQRNGWVQGQTAQSQEALNRSVEMGVEKGFDDWTKIPAKQVLEMTGMRVGVPHGLSRRAATWNPARWVWSLLEHAVASGKVELYTHTSVGHIEDTGDSYIVHTNRGFIRAKYVINATESYSALIHPELRGKLGPVQTQAVYGEGGPAAMKEHVGMGTHEVWFGRRGSGVIFGSDATPLHYSQAGRIRPSRFMTKFILGEMQRVFGPSRVHVTREWSCTAGFTDDEYPIVGALDGKRQFIIAGMCGSGSGVHFNAARHVVEKLVLGLPGPDDYPAEFFAPSRVIDPSAHPWPGAD